MFPYFILFDQTFSMFTIMGLAGFFAALSVAYIRAKRHGIAYIDIVIGSFIAGVFLIVGASLLNAIVRLGHFIQIFHRFEGNLLLMLQFLFGGMVFYGGLFGVFFGLWVVSKVFKQKLGFVLTLAVPVMPLAHAIMRIGCFLGGCCYGIEHQTLGIAFTRSLGAPNGVPLLPVQLFEVTFNLLLFAALWAYSKKPRRALHIVVFYGMSYGIGRFLLEFLRGDAARGFVFGLSASQFISALVILACIIALLIAHIYKKRGN